MASERTNERKKLFVVVRWTNGKACRFFNRRSSRFFLTTGSIRAWTRKIIVSLDSRKKTHVHVKKGRMDESDSRDWSIQRASVVVCAARYSCTCCLFVSRKPKLSRQCVVPLACRVRHELTSLRSAMARPRCTLPSTLTSSFQIRRLFVLLQHENGSTRFSP